MGQFVSGRVPSTPDERDYKMSRVFDRVDSDPLLAAFTKMQASHLTATAVKHWATEVMKKLDVAPAPPTPDPTPVPPAPPVTPVETAKYWKIAYGLDQGQTPHCVGFGTAHWGICDPINDAWQHADAEAIYYECKVIDGEPKAEDGSSVRTAAKAMKARKRLTTYVFAESVDDVKRWIMEHGPVVIGSDFYAGMENPSSNGLVRPTGQNLGGHCYLMTGYDDNTKLFEFKNSWGDGWGVKGYFYMLDSDFGDLLAAQGEAMAATEIAL